MHELYFVLAALHIRSMAITGILWTLIDLKLAPALKPHVRDIRAAHFGSLYLVPWFLGLAYAFDRLKVPASHQAFFPIGWGALVFFSGRGYVFPRPRGVDRALELFVESGLTALPVIDESNDCKVLGLVQRSDISTAYLRHVHGLVEEQLSKPSPAARTTSSKKANRA